MKPYLLQPLKDRDLRMLMRRAPKPTRNGFDLHAPLADELLMRRAAMRRIGKLDPDQFLISWGTDHIRDIIEECKRTAAKRGGKGRRA